MNNWLPHWDLIWAKYFGTITVIDEYRITDANNQDTHT